MLCWTTKMHSNKHRLWANSMQNSKGDKTRVLNHEELLRHRFMCSRNFSLTLLFCRMCTTIHQCWWFIQVHQAGHTTKPPIKSMNKTYKRYEQHDCIPLIFSLNATVFEYTLHTLAENSRETTPTEDKSQ